MEGKARSHAGSTLNDPSPIIVSSDSEQGNDDLVVNNEDYMALDVEEFIHIQPKNDGTSDEMSLSSNTRSVYDSDDDLTIKDVNGDIEMTQVEDPVEWTLTRKT